MHKRTFRACNRCKVSAPSLEVSWFQRTYWIQALVNFTTLLGAMWCAHAHANGFLEVVGGSSWATGGELESSRTWGGQLHLGWGGRAQSMSEGSAIYGYGAVSLDQINQTGPLDLGKPDLKRSQIGITAGVRYYERVAERMRLWFDLGTGYTLDDSETTITGLSPTQLNTQSFTITTALGVQYRLEAKLLLSIGYYQAFFVEKDKMGLAERALISDGDNSSFGRGRLAIGLGWYL